MTAADRASSLALAVVGNCEVAGLLDTRGRIVWACLPRPDSDPIFCSLLDARGGDAERGVFAIELAECGRSPAKLPAEYRGRRNASSTMPPAIRCG